MYLMVAVSLLFGLFLSMVGGVQQAQAADTSDYSSVKAVLVDLDGNITGRSTVTLPQGAIDTTVKNNNLTTKTFGRYTGVYQGAYWLSGVMSGLGTPSQSVFDGKRLPLKSLTKNDDGSTVVTPTDDVVTPGQGAVILSALSSEVNQHAVLVYLDTRYAKLVHFTFGGALTNKSTSAFSTLVYDSATDNARFAVVDQNASSKRYKTTAYVKVPRGQQVSFSAKNSDGTTQTVTPTLISDDSTTDYTVQTYTLEINELVDEINVTTSALSTKKVKMVARMQGESIGRYDQPQFNISYIDTGLVTKTWDQWPTQDESDDQRWSNKLPNMRPGAKAIDFTPNGSGKYGTRGPRVWGFQTDTANGGSSIAPETSNGNGLVTSESAYKTTVSNRAVYTVEAIPTLHPNGTDPLDEVYRQDFLSSITLTNLDQATGTQSNAQTIMVPFPDLCRDPNGSTGSEGEYCFMGATWWPYWTGYGNFKNRYSCVRAWMFGQALTRYENDIKEGCGRSYDINDSKAVSYSPRVMLDYTIDQGANAGTQIIVKLLNARINDDTGVSILDSKAYAEGSGSFPATINAARWRTRYQIEVYNPQNSNMEIVANWDWSNQPRVLLGASSGIEPIAGSNDTVKTTAVSVYGVGNANVGGVDGQLNWKSICVNGQNLGADGGPNGGQGCRYVWQNQGSYGTMPVGMHVKNGFKKPDYLLYVPKRYSGGINGPTPFVQYQLGLTNPVSNEQDGNLYVDLPKAEGTTLNIYALKRNRTMLMESRLPLYVNAKSVDIPLTYYDDQGTHLNTYTTDAGAKPFADTTVNVVTDPFRNVASVAPALTSTDATGKPQIFTHWVLKAYKNGQELGTVGNKSTDGSVKNYNVVSPRDLLHLSNPVFTSVTSSSTARSASALAVGDPVITDGTGTAVADELRLVAVPMTTNDTTTGLTRKYEYYPVRHVVKDTAGTHVVRAFDYTAVPGLSALITDQHIDAWPKETYNSKKYPYYAAGSITKIGDPTKAWDATTNAGLVSPSTSLLEMLYRTPGAPLTFGKSLDKTLYNMLKGPATGAMPGYDFTANDKSHSDFRLVLTPKTPTTGSEITVNAYDGNDNTSAPSDLAAEFKAEVPQGTYTLKEQVKSGADWVAASPWYPKRGADLTCTNASLNEDRTELTVPEGQTTIDCRLTNTTAALAVLTYDASSNSYVTSGAYKAGVPTGETYATAIDALANAATVPGALTWVAPEVAYSVAPTTVPAGYTLLGYQKFTLTDQDQQLSAHTSTGNWGAVDTTTPQAASAFVAGLLSDPSNGSGVTRDTVATAAAQSVTTAANGITVLRAVIFPTAQLSTLTFKATTNTTDYNPQGGKGDASDDTKYALQLRWSGGTGAIKHNSTNLSDGNPVATDGTVSASHFYLRAGAQYAYKERYQGGSTTSTVTGFAELSDNYHINNAWAPVSMTCEPTATVNHTAGSLLAFDGRVTLPAGNVTCTMVNKAAQLGVLIWDRNNKTWLDSSEYSVNVDPTDSGFIDAGDGWIAKGDRVHQSTTQISPGGTYKVVKANMPFLWNVNKCQLLADADGNPISYTSGTNLDTANWVDTDCTKVTAKAGEYRVVRAVATFNPFVPTLPLTGGRPSDLFTLLGLLAIAFATATSVVARKRRRVEV